MSINTQTQTQLPTSVLIHIFDYVDLKTLCSIKLTCHQYNNICNENEIWDKFCRQLTTQIIDHCIGMTQQVNILKQLFQPPGKDRLDFLHSTLTLLYQSMCQYRIKSSWKTSSDHRTLVYIFNALLKQLTLTGKMLTQIEFHNETVTVNFDIFELALRRYHYELMFILTDWIKSPLVLTDHQLIWNTHCHDRLSCTFQQFIELLKIYTQHSQLSERLIQHLSHLINFPQDNIISIYRYHCFLSLFGPISNCIENFQHYALGSGFVGLCNLIKAEEIIKQLNPSNNLVLFRYSRQQPQALAFTSYNHVKGKIEHRRNLTPDKQIIPIAQFLKEQYPGYLLADVRVDDVATLINDMFIYSQSSDPYITYVTV